MSGQQLWASGGNVQVVFVRVLGSGSGGDVYMVWDHTFMISNRVDEE